MKLLNKNLKNLWDFEFKITNKKYNNFYNSNINHFIMYSSNNYLSKIYPWKNTRTQLDLMIKTKCINPFFLIINNIIS